MIKYNKAQFLKIRASSNTAAVNLSHPVCNLLILPLIGAGNVRAIVTFDPPTIVPTELRGEMGFTILTGWASDIWQS